MLFSFTCTQNNLLFLPSTKKGPCVIPTGIEIFFSWYKLCRDTITINCLPIWLLALKHTRKALSCFNFKQTFVNEVPLGLFIPIISTYFIYLLQVSLGPLTLFAVARKLNIIVCCATIPITRDIILKENNDCTAFFV